MRPCLTVTGMNNVPCHCLSSYLMGRNLRSRGRKPLASCWWVRKPPQIRLTQDPSQQVTLLRGEFPSEGDTCVQRGGGQGALASGCRQQLGGGAHMLLFSEGFGTLASPRRFWGSHNLTAARRAAAAASWPGPWTLPPSHPPAKPRHLAEGWP